MGFFRGIKDRMKACDNWAAEQNAKAEQKKDPAEASAAAQSKFSTYIDSLELDEATKFEIKKACALAISEAMNSL